MGSGGAFYEAAYTLTSDIPAGSTHFVLDGTVVEPVDVTFDWIWRHASGSADTILAEWTEHYEPLGSGLFGAQAFRYDEDCAAVEHADGDQIILRYTGNNATGADAYIPNGDQVTPGAEDPNITLPQ